MSILQQYHRPRPSPSTGYLNILHDYTQFSRRHAMEFEITGNDARERHSPALRPRVSFGWQEPSVCAAAELLAIE